MVGLKVSQNLSQRVFSDHSGHSSLVSFKWLKDQKKLREGWRPRCEASEEIIPRFTSDLAWLTDEGVFVQQLGELGELGELGYHRPGLFCVDGRLDDSAEAGQGLQPSFAVVLACRDSRENTGGRQCPLSLSCHSRCCQPWQVWHSALRTCKYSKSKHSRRNR